MLCLSTTRHFKFNTYWIHALLPVVEVDDFVEEECPASGASEPGGDQLTPVGQKRLAMDAAEQAEPAQMRQVMAPHDVSSS